MFKLSKSVITIAAMAFIAIGATSAYFTDTEMMAGNNFAFGTLDLTIADEESFTPISMSNITPGDTFQKVINIDNAGSIDFGSLKLAASNVEDASGLLSQIDANIQYFANTNTEAETSIDLGTIKLDALVNSIEMISDPAYNLGAGNKGTVVISVSIPAELGNEYQSVGASFDLVFDAEQIK